MSAGTKAYTVVLAAHVLGVWLIVGAEEPAWGLLCITAGLLVYGGVRLEQYMNRNYPEETP